MRKEAFYKKAAMFAMTENLDKLLPKKFEEDREYVCKKVAEKMGVENLTIAGYNERGEIEEVKITFDVKNFNKMDFIPAPEELNFLSEMVFVHVIFSPSFFYPGFLITNLVVPGVSLNRYTVDMIKYLVRHMLMTKV